MNRHSRVAAAVLLCSSIGAVAAATSLSACSTDTTGSGPPADTGDAQVPIDAPVSTSDGGGDAASGSSPSGSIAIFSSALGTTQTANIVFDANPRPSTACTVTVAGDCKVTECKLGDGGAIEPPLVGAYASAGTITFRGGNPETSFTAEPKADGSYDAPLFTSNGRAFAGGESATLSATGGAVPAFTQALTYPLLFILEQPAIADGGSGTLTVPRTQDFTFAWSRGTPDADVVLQGSSGASPATSVSLQCRFAAATGSATLPQSLLTRMNAGTTILVFSAGKVTTQTGPYTVTTYLAGEMLTPSKTAAVSLVLQ